jgi:hemerythrin superfamily protein
MESTMATATQTTTNKKRSAGRKSASGKSKTASSASRTQDAVALLKADHRTVEKLFSQFEKARDESQKQQIAGQICMELTIHTQIEEEIFYPTSREFLDDDEIVNEAVIEHAAAKDLIAEIEAGDPSDEMFDAKVKVLQEQIEHHVEEEEKEYFPQLQKTDMDLKAIGERMKMRKQELMAEMGGEGRAMQ